MDNNIIQSIDRFIAENQRNIVRDIGRVVAVNSVLDPSTATADKPFGEGPAKVLEVGLEIAKELGLETYNCENMIGYASIGDAGTLERLDGAIYSLSTEVEGMVICHRQEVEARLGKPHGIALRHAEHMGILRVRAIAWHTTLVEQHALEVAQRKVGINEVATHIIEEVAAVVLGEAWRGIVHAKHHIAHACQT